MKRRVAVTGIGVISALGPTRAAFWDALGSGRGGIRPITLVPQGSTRFPNAAEVPDYRAAEYFDEKEVGFLDRFSQFALIAAREAVTDAAIDFDAALRENSAIVTGSCAGGQTTEDEGFHGLYALKNDTLGGMSPPLNFKKGQPNPINCWYWMKVSHGKFTTPYGTSPTCKAPPAG